MFIIPNRSASISVACCHIDFRLENLIAIEDKEYVEKINKIDKIIKNCPKKPDLVVFPEGSYTKFLEDVAIAWAFDGVTTICGTFLDKDQIIKAPIIAPNGMRFLVEKESPSPYDYSLSRQLVRKGAPPLGPITVTIKDNHGDPIDVNIAVLICYDYRNHFHEFQNINDVQLVVVPMFDKDFRDVQSIAKGTAFSAYQRTFLVNKAVLNTLRSDYYKPSFFMRIINKIRIVRLESSCHGQINGSQAKRLKKLFSIKADVKNKTIWKQKKECIVLASYEILHPLQPGPNNVYDTQPTYDRFELFKI